MDITAAAALQGLDRAKAELEKAAERIARPPLVAADIPPQDAVNLSEEAIRLTEARNLYKLQLKVLKTAAEVQEHTLDILA
jgi:hypothetical protein